MRVFRPLGRVDLRHWNLLALRDMEGRVKSAAMRGLDHAHAGSLPIRLDGRKLDAIGFGHAKFQR